MKTVLVIEDDARVAESLRIRLSSQGYEVLHAPNGAEGRYIALRRRIDVVILDLGLPDNHGLEVCDSIRQAAGARQPKIIIYTAQAEPVSPEVALCIGADAYVPKRNGYAGLIEAIRNLDDPASPILNDQRFQGP